MKIYENYNRKKIWTYPFLDVFLFAITLLAQKPGENTGEPFKGNPQLFQSGRLYYLDKVQTQLYTGEYREYHDNGTLKLEIQIRNGLKHGTWRIWDELGNLRYEMGYRDGKKVGNWRMWNEWGALEDEKQY
jgi:antitoxin component YwqK of YwqJK toxin-antitoxin module